MFSIIGLISTMILIPLLFYFSGSTQSYSYTNSNLDKALFINQHPEAEDWINRCDEDDQGIYTIYSTEKLDNRLFTRVLIYAPSNNYYFNGISEHNTIFKKPVYNINLIQNGAHENNQNYTLLYFDFKSTKNSNFSIKINGEKIKFKKEEVSFHFDDSIAQIPYDDSFFNIAINFDNDVKNVDVAIVDFFSDKRKVTSNIESLVDNNYVGLHLPIEEIEHFSISEFQIILLDANKNVIFKSEKLSVDRYYYEYLLAYNTDDKLKLTPVQQQIEE